jgi:hypothetical protein
MSVWREVIFAPRGRDDVGINSPNGNTGLLTSCDGVFGTYTPNKFDHGDSPVLLSGAHLVSGVSEREYPNPQECGTGVRTPRVVRMSL